MWYVCVIYIYITSQPAIFLFQNQGVKQCNLSGSCQLGCFLFHGGTVFRYRSSSLWLPNWFATSDLRCGTVGHLTRHELLKQKRGCETSNWRHPKKNAHWLCLWTFNSILCLSGIPLKQKNGKKPRQKWRNYKKKRLNKNLARKTTTSKWRSHVHPEHQSTMWTTNQNPTLHRFSEIPNSLGAPETVESQQTADGYSNWLHSVLELIFVVNSYIICLYLR